jgi:hypothetical protein
LAATTRRKPWARRWLDRRGWRLFLLAAFAVAMGHLEAVVVVYIRAILHLIPTPEDLTKVVVAKLPAWVFATERTREAATLVMLVCVALLAGRNAWERLGTFLVAFGIWDLTYYASLKVMLDWPRSLETLDLLFLIPKQWYAPVWIPMAASGGMIAVGVLCLALAPRPGSRRAGT